MELYPRANERGTSRILKLPKREVKIIDNPLTPEIAIDCEMVEATANGKRFSVLARVSIVNSNLNPLLDTYVDPMYKVSDYRTRFSGIKPHHLKDAPTFSDVRDCVVNLVDGRTLIGHDLKQDLEVLGIRNLPGLKLRDTSRCYLSYFRPNEMASLKRLAESVLGQTIQKGPHNSMEDAIAAMELYKHWIHLGRNEEDAVPLEKVGKKKNKNKSRGKRHSPNGKTQPHEGQEETKAAAALGVEEEW